MCNTSQKMRQDLVFPTHYQPHYSDNYGGLYAPVSTYPLLKKVVKNVEFDQIFEIEQHLMARIHSVSVMMPALFSCRTYFRHLKTKQKNKHRHFHSATFLNRDPILNFRESEFLKAWLSLWLKKIKIIFEKTGYFVLLLRISPPLQRLRHQNQFQRRKK